MWHHRVGELPGKNRPALEFSHHCTHMKPQPDQDLVPHAASVRLLPIATEVMVSEVVTVAPDMAIVDAIATLLHRGFSGAPVVSAGGELLGMLSENDCMRALSAAAFDATPTGTVAEHMTRAVRTVTPNTDVYALTQEFQDHRVRRLPVVEGKRLVGLITRRDLLRALDRTRREREERAARPLTTYESIAAQRKH